MPKLTGLPHSALSASTFLLFLHLLITPASGQLANQAGSPLRLAKWEPSIQAFEDQDKASAPPTGETLLVGGSNARRWSTVDRQLPDHQVLNRAFGGARLAEIVHFADRIILPYAPSILLVNAGGNDLGSGTTPDELHAIAKELLKTVHGKLPDTTVYFIGIPYVRKVSSKPEAMEFLDKANQGLASLAKENTKVEFIDLSTPLLDEDGRFQPNLYVKDGVHFSTEGYKKVAAIVGKALQ